VLIHRLFGKSIAVATFLGPPVSGMSLFMPTGICLRGEQPQKEPVLIQFHILGADSPGLYIIIAPLYINFV
jgi:hypothetical protein